MTDAALRADFEAWAVKEYFLPSDLPRSTHYQDQYIRPEVHMCWLAYRAGAARVGIAGDTERFEWYFGPCDKGAWMNEYLRGMRAGWTVNQWRAAIDAAREQPPQREEKAADYTSGASTDGQPDSERAKLVEWIDEAVRYVGCGAWSPSLERQGNDLLARYGRQPEKPRIEPK